MNTLKIKFKPHPMDGKRYQAIRSLFHCAEIQQQETDAPHSIAKKNYHMLKVILQPCRETTKQHLFEFEVSNQMIKNKLEELIFNPLNCGNTTNCVSSDFATNTPKSYLFPFMEETIKNLQSLGKIRTAETYTATLNSFKRFRIDEDLPLNEIDSDIMMAYEVYLRNNGVSLNTSSFYMRNLRAVYNRAVDKGITTQYFPFKHVYTGVDKTIKRAVPLNVIKKIKNMDLSQSPTFDFARDMFLFSFYTRGMSFVDMAYLRKKNLTNGILTYRRRKTGQQLIIKWEKCMQEIIDKYNPSSSLYLLPIINPMRDTDERKQYIYAAHNINRCLKIIGKKLGLTISLTLYVARHAWASIAKSKNIPISIISEGMGHDSETTTRIYLASLDSVAIDEANNMILESLI